MSEVEHDVSLEEAAYVYRILTHVHNQMIAACIHLPTAARVQYVMAQVTFMANHVGAANPRMDALFAMTANHIDDVRVFSDTHNNIVAEAESFLQEAVPSDEPQEED